MTASSPTTTGDAAVPDESHIEQLHDDLLAALNKFKVMTETVAASDAQEKIEAREVWDNLASSFAQYQVASKAQPENVLEMTQRNQFLRLGDGTKDSPDRQVHLIDLYQRSRHHTQAQRSGYLG